MTLRLGLGRSRFGHQERRRTTIQSPWIAIDSTSDRNARALALTAARESVLAGSRAPTGVVRSVISASWKRSRNAGVDADAGVAPVVDEHEAKERWREHPVAAALPAARDLLRDVGSSAHQVLLFCDVDGTLLWFDGERDVVRRARDARLERGAVWSEQAAGTNAMGTALATDHPVQVFSAEHYARAVSDWTCSAAPVKDPDTGQTVGVLDLSGGIETAHPHSLAVVTAAAQVIEQALHRVADEAAGRLVTTYGQRIGSGPAGPDALAMLSGRVLVSAHTGLAGRRLELPPDGGQVGLTGGGSVMAEPVLGGGYLLWVVGDPREAARDQVQMKLLGTGGATVTVGGQVHHLSPRHAEVLALLALRPQGWTAEQLTEELLGDHGKPVTIRAELSRLRRVLGPLLGSQPYRLTAAIETDYEAVEQRLAAADVSGALKLFAAGELLPFSESPTIAEARFRLTMSVREAVAANAEPELLAAWLQLPAGYDDAQACRTLIALCPPADPRHALAAGRLRRLAGAH